VRAGRFSDADGRAPVVTGNVLALVATGRPEKHPTNRGLPQGVLVDRQQDTSGDYGYDLAHEATGRGRAPDDRAGQAQGDRSPAVGKADQGEDLGYDEAHDC
jgi:hypothetical protein